MHRGIDPTKDIIGKIFERLEVISYYGRKGPQHYYNCKCSCGTEKLIRRDHLLQGNSKSCGCLRYEIDNTESATTHGLSYTKIYKVWSSIKDRCLNAKHKAYANYGGRGIGICERWLDFQSFYEDMSETYQEGLSLDRIDNQKGYSKENCRWVSMKEQGNNKRTNRIITVDGVSKTVSQWAEHYGMKPSTIHNRLSYKKPVEQLFLKSKRWRKDEK